MKKYISILAFGLVLSSCQKLVDDIADPSGELIEVNFEGSESSVTTRVSYTESDHTFTFSWHTGDKVSLIVDEVEANKNFEFTAATAAKSSNFTGKLSTWNGEKNVYSVFPYSNTPYTITIGSTLEQTTVSLSSVNQIATVGNNNKFANGFMVAAGSGATATNESNYNIPLLAYKQVMSFLKFNITNIPSKERVTEIGLTTDGTVEFISNSDVILSTGVLSGTPTKVNSLSATVQDASVGTITEVNFALFPVDLSGKDITIYLKTTDGSNERSYKLTKTGKNFKRNVIYKVTFDIDLSAVSVIVNTGEVLQSKIEELSYTTSNITNLTISGTKELDATDFTYLKSLGNIKVLDMSNSATKVIPSDPFFFNTSLLQIYLPKELTTIGEHAFMFSNLTSVTIPKSLTTWGSEAFRSCTSLTSVTLTEGLTTIGESAFRSCTSLTSVTLTEGLTTIGESAFRGSGLTSVTIPSTVTFLGDKAFEETSKLKTVDLLPEAPPQVYSTTFDATVINFYVPTAAAVAAYKDDSRWSSYKDRISSRK